MPEATLVDTGVERTVTFPEAMVEATTVRNSVIDRGATLGGLDLRNAMIGAYTHIPDGSRE